MNIFSLQYIRMSGKSISFNDIKIKKSDFHKNKKINNIKDINADNILVSKKEPYGTKNKIHLNTLLDIMIMILLHRYA